MAFQPGDRWIFQLGAVLRTSTFHQTSLCYLGSGNEGGLNMRDFQFQSNFDCVLGIFTQETELLPACPEKVLTFTVNC